MKTRSAPKVGYATPEKQAYREEVWAALISGWHDYKHRHDAHVLILPSSEGVEIDYLLTLGVPAGRIIAVDKSAAVIATSTWRKKHPDVKFMATTIGDCGPKLAKRKINVCAANLDFCSNFCSGLVHEFSSFMRTAPIYEFARVAVTVAKGREATATSLLLKHFASGYAEYKESRIGALMALSNDKLVADQHLILAQGAYMSGRTPMAWAVRSKNFVHARWAEQHKKALLEMDLAAAAGALFKSNARYKDAELRRAASAWLANTFITPDIKKYEAEVANYTEVGLARLELLGVVPIVEQVKSGIMQAYYALQDVSAPSRVISY